ncbi:hypothetical protein BpHYR1_006838 [Brachionus plicatilis]|uniref:Uncharacterized protein n=1 Tax=Brachionus plicatilis TaxID=10195 RepID=A0A3M7PHB7_BRAPC|nr:hypothetical protein BpHYR1_006838 [Brachionus plicatilis]
MIYGKSIALDNPKEYILIKPSYIYTLNKHKILIKIGATKFFVQGTLTIRNRIFQKFCQTNLGDLKMKP